MSSACIGRLEYGRISVTSLWYQECQFILNCFLLLLTTSKLTDSEVRQERTEHCTSTLFDRVRTKLQTGHQRWSSMMFFDSEIFGLWYSGSSLNARFRLISLNNLLNNESSARESPFYAHFSRLFYPRPQVCLEIISILPLVSDRVFRTAWAGAKRDRRETQGGSERQITRICRGLFSSFFPFWSNR